MNNFFFINVYTSINIIISLQRNGLMFKTSLKLYLTSFLLISRFFHFFFPIGFTFITPVSERRNSIIKTLNHGGKPNQTLLERVQLISYITHFTIRYCKIPKNVFSHCLTCITFFTIHYRLLSNHVSYKEPLLSRPLHLYRSCS